MPGKRRESKKSPSESPRRATAVMDQEPSQKRAGGDVPAGQDAFGELALASPLTTAQWKTLRESVLKDFRSAPPKGLFGDSVHQGSVYRWGLATAFDRPLDDEFQWLSRVAAGVTRKRDRVTGEDACRWACQFQEALPGGSGDAVDAAAANLWAAAMPGLLQYLKEHDWWSLLGTLQDFRERQLQRDETRTMALIAVTEMGLTLSHHLRALPSCRRMTTSSVALLRRWCDRDNLAVTDVLSQPHHSRLVLASLWRIRRLLDHVVPITQTSKKKRAKRDLQLRAAADDICTELTTWIAAMTRSGGVQAFSSLAKADVRDDGGPRGLLLTASECGFPTDTDQKSKPASQTLLPAMKAALGDKSTQGRLAWQVSLPEALLNDEEAKLACLLPEWDVRRGRMTIAYDSPQMRVELVAGKSAVLSGVCEVQLSIDGQVCQPNGEWVTTCEYTDDDVHYLELEHPYEGGVVLQRQFMVLREDRCCLVADAVVESGQGKLAAGQASRPREIEYQLRLPLGNSIVATPESETTEILLGDDRTRGLLVPLAVNEWKTAAGNCRLEVTNDQHVVMRSRGVHQLFAPLWFDLSRPRFKRPRTWRKLTVAENLHAVPDHAAKAFRIQLGKAQWILYRSLSAAGPRTFFGKQMIADFYCARFDSDTQHYEDLITVEADLS